MNGHSTDRTVVDTCETMSHLSIRLIAQVSAEGSVLIEVQCRLFEEHGTNHLGSNTLDGCRRFHCICDRNFTGRQSCSYASDLVTHALDLCFLVKVSFRADRRPLYKACQHSPEHTDGRSAITKRNDALPRGSGAGLA